MNKMKHLKRAILIYLRHINWLIYYECPENEETIKYIIKLWGNFIKNYAKIQDYAELLDEFEFLKRITEEARELLRFDFKQQKYGEINEY